MARHEYQAQQVIADLVHLSLRGAELLRLEFLAERLVLGGEHAPAPQVIERAVAGGAHQPGARVVRHPRARPVLQRAHQRILRELLGQADIAHQARQAGDQPGRLDAPYRLDLLMHLRHGDG